ncbi:Cytochrome c oxidase subunit [Musa troglodytarum]|uniref:Cytochrome c oxidase subunit n=1 Tax=Musa troglodytarum TaxID=320322 RepID=A0A9E7KQ18_9LILI|nr:Cytochrome c oxidase subunit [Musa troglodytarum]
MVIRWRKATRFPRDRASASSTSSPLRMTTTPLFSAVSGRLDISSHPISISLVFHRTSKLILRSLGWFLVPHSASGDGSLKKIVEDVMPIATGLVRKELEGKKRFYMDAPVGPFGTKKKHTSAFTSPAATHPCVHPPGQRSSAAAAVGPRSTPSRPPASGYLPGCYSPRGTAAAAPRHADQP